MQSDPMIMFDLKPIYFCMKLVLLSKYISSKLCMASSELHFMHVSIEISHLLPFLSWCSQLLQYKHAIQPNIARFLGSKMQPHNPHTYTHNLIFDFHSVILHGTWMKKPNLTPSHSTRHRPPGSHASSGY